MSTFSPGLTILHANHPEDLRELVLDLIRRHPLAPLQNEVFLVQSNGMAQWLRLRLAQDDGLGIAAALDMQMPSRFLWQAYRAVLGAEAVPATSPFDKQPLIWRLMRLLPACLTQAPFAPLRDYLADDSDLRKRYPLAERLADLFDQYQVYRADWLEDWAEGRDVLRDPQGQILPLPPEQRWQPHLWRFLRDDIGAAHHQGSRAAVHPRFLQALRDRHPQTQVRGLPPRLIVFGISALPLQALEALDALSRVIPVFICVNNPCRYYWADIIEDRQLLRFEQRRHALKAGLAGLDAEQLHARVNPLLAAWGRQGRDYIGMLYAYDQSHAGAQQVDLFLDRLDPAKPCLLHALQQGILDLAPAPHGDAPRQAVSPEDTSIRFVHAHSRQREVDILHDHLLDLFAHHPDLQPRDVMVMVPDISLYAPHVEAAFGYLASDDPRHIPYTLADRPARAHNPLLMALERLLDLPDARLGASDLLDLLEVAAFRARFGIQAEELARLQAWIRGSGIRWGLHAEHRADLDLPPGLTQNTWQFGVRRMLLGYANGASRSDEDARWHDIEPYAETGGLEADSAGKLADVIHTLDPLRTTLAIPHTPADWQVQLNALLACCFEPDNSQDILLLDRFRDVLAEWVNTCTDVGLSTPLPLSVVREALFARFDDQSLSQRFLAGRVNIGTLMPMRAIPFQVVCLLGMNDGDYPRQRLPMDFDLMAARYRPGDRSRREDDRYLFLEALLSARQQLYISHVARSERDNSERPASVLVGQLRDHIAQGWVLAGHADPQALLAHLTVQHPLQPFSRQYFLPDTHPQKDARLFTYAWEWREVHNLPAPVSGAPQLAPWYPDEPLDAQRLIRFLRQPADTFFRERLNIRINPGTPLDEDDEPFQLDKLEMHQLKSQLIQDALQASDDTRAERIRQTLQRLQGSGRLPLGSAATLTRQALLQACAALLTHWQPLRAAWPTARDRQPVNLTLPSTHGEVRLVDWVDQLYTQGEPNDRTCLRLDVNAGQAWSGKSGSRGTRKYHYFVRLWIYHLLGCAEGLNLTSALVTPDGVHTLKPLAEDIAHAHLTTLASLWQAGLQRVLPAPFKTAFAWLDDRTDQDDLSDEVPEAVIKAYEEGFAERDDSLALQRCWPDARSLWQADFRALAMALYEPLREALNP